MGVFLKDQKECSWKLPRKVKQRAIEGHWKSKSTAGNIRKAAVLSLFPRIPLPTKKGLGAGPESKQAGFHYRSLLKKALAR